MTSEGAFGLSEKTKGGDERTLREKNSMEKRGAMGYGPVYAPPIQIEVVRR